MENIEHKKIEFTEFCHLIHSKNLVFGSGGNVSIRCGDTILITPSGKSLESLTADDIIEMNMSGEYKGKGKPSTECFMHIACYKARPEINTVVHVHSIYATAVSCIKGLCMDKAMPVYTPGYGKRVNALPVVPYLRPGSKELAESAGKIISERNSVLLKNHGVITVGKSMEMALNLAEEIEENAQLTLVLGSRGEELSPENISDLVNYGS